MTDNDDQIFEAAFQEATQGTPADQTDPPEPDSPQAAETEQDQGADSPPEAPESNQPDIWANAPPELRSAYEAERQRAERLEHQRRSDEGRVATFQRQRDTYRRQLETFTNAATQEDLASYVQSDDWQKAKAEYGDDLNPLFRAVEAMVDVNQKAQDRFSQLDKVQAEAFERSAESYLTERAPDWKDLLSGGDFLPWLQSQPPHVQALYAHNEAELLDPEEVLDLVGKYRAYRFIASPDAPTEPAPQPQPIDQKRAVQLDGSRTVRSRQPELNGDASDDFEGYFNQAARQKENERSSLRR